MRRLILGVTCAVIAGLLALWWSGGFDQLAAWAAGHQRDFQNQIALGLRGVRAGNAGAFATLLGVCFAYGFFHAAGPGHGKLLMGGYGLGRDVPALRLSLIGLAASLGQAVTAVALVYAGIWLFSLTRERLVGVADDMLAPFSYGAICLIGGWLIWRGVRRMRGSKHTGHAAHGGGHCDDCGHAHGPTLAEVEALSGWRETAILIGGIAMRPCTGALFVLILTWQMGIAVAGIAGAFAMALGTALITVSVGLGAAGLRGGLLRGVAGAQSLTIVMPLVEIAAGVIVVTLSMGLLLRL